MLKLEMSCIKPKNSFRFAGIIKLNDVNYVMIYMAFIIPHNIASEDAINKFKTKVPAVITFVPVLNLPVT